MKIQARTRKDQGLALGVWLAISAVIIVAGIAIIVWSRGYSRIDFLGVKIESENVFLAGFAVAVAGAVAGIKAWRSRKSDTPGVTITNSKNVNISSSGAIAGDTHRATPPPRTRYMGDD